MIDAEDLEERKRSLPKHIFEQEYLAKFIDNASGLFKNVDSCVIKPAERTQKLFGGLDIGRADDYTVLTILNKNYQMVYVQRWRQQEWSKIIDEVATKIREYNAEIFVEVNNQGDVFFEMLQNKVYNNVQPYVTTTATKPIMIEDLAVHFENKDIGILNENWLVDELNAFTYIYNEKTRRVQYGAPQGIHDDGVMSLALAVQSIKKNQYGYFEVY